MALNNCVFIGRLTRDIEMKTVGNNVSVANFTLAVERRFKSKDESQPTADFIPICAWRKTAEFAEKYFNKGKQVFVRGSLETYSYEKNGEIKYSFRVNAEEVGFADSGKDDGENKNQGQGNNTPKSMPPVNQGGNEFGNPSDFDFIDTDDDLPF